MKSRTASLVRLCSCFAAAVLLAACVCLCGGPAGQSQPAGAGDKKKLFAVVFDFTAQDGGGKSISASADLPLEKQDIGRQLADSVRLKLAKNPRYELIDRLSTQEFSPPLPAGAEVRDVAKLMSERVGANIGVCGTVRKDGNKVSASVRMIDLTDPAGPAGWIKEFSDDTERARGVIAMQIVEAITNEPAWVPPQYGDEPEPKNFGRPLNVNGDFEAGNKGWDRPDNVSTFIADGPKDRGKILRVRTDLQRDPWLEYTRNLRLGKADPSNPPKIEKDTGYSSVAGLEGVHYNSEFLPAWPGQRYWLTADVSADSQGMFFPKVFVKGFKRTDAAKDGLPESSLAAMGLTPEQFAAMVPEKRKQLIEQDSKANPMRYMRETYRWYLSCRSKAGQWMHFAAPFPPRGGLPADVEFLQIQIYSYWPPGEYLWDNVFLFKDPNQAATQPEEKARTPNFRKADSQPAEK
ncbi:MAG: hypothetical protein HZA50_10335 [Planctomycetes bacterium]|nr:hypothetical protein [Planctomycetota bacterium]